MKFGTSHMVFSRWVMQRLVGQLPNMGIPTAYVGACTSDPNPHPELI
jgi:hypothetical protein